jgi:(2Fe-2S) ferredoxin
MFAEITGALEVGVTHDGEIIVFVEGVWQAVVSPTGAREIASHLYLAAAEAETIIAARNN